VRFGNTPALDGVDLDVGDGEIVAVLGASGSGKTTLLRAVAGLQRLDGGRILWDGDDLRGVPAHERRFGLMFQDFALFPHLDVGRNVEFGLRMLRVPPDERRSRVRKALERVELPDFERRRVGTLSGGQAQRVALARALAPGPRMLLLDEPLGSLDRALRERLTEEMPGLFARLGITGMYVTHDQAEAFAVADRVAILDGGRIVQVGTPERLWRNPATAAVAQLLGLRTLVEVVVDGDTADSPIGRLPVPEGTPPGWRQVVVTPHAFYLDPNGVFEATVRSHRFRGSDYLVSLEINGMEVAVALDDPPPAGTGVRLAVSVDGIVLVGGTG
jgi:thiamine transport system ATP-binding protein